MRSRPRSIGAIALIASGLSAILAGCSTGGYQEPVSTASLAPRPHQGMVRDEPRRYPDGSTSGRPYANGSYQNGDYGRPYAQSQNREPRYGDRRYVDPGQPVSRDVASNYDAQRGYGAPNIQTGSLGQHGHADPYANDQNARWQQPVAAPRAGQYGGAMPRVVEVQEGDTLYNLSRRYDVPVNDLVAANRLPTDRIAIGQRLVIPTRYR